MDSQSVANQVALSGRYLTFALSKERYGLEILKVQEIIGVPTITRVPRCPNYVKGVINLRGKVIPLIDLRLKFGLTPIPYDEKTCIVVVNLRIAETTLSVGIIVDTVLEVINFERQEIEPAPDYGTQLGADFIVGMGRKQDGPVNILIDIERTLTRAELENLTKNSA